MICHTILNSLLKSSNSTSAIQSNRQPKLYDQTFLADDKQQLLTAEDDRGGQLGDEAEEDEAKPKQLFGVPGPFGYYHHLPFSAGYLDPSQLYQQYAQYIPEIDMQVDVKYIMRK